MPEPHVRDEITIADFTVEVEVFADGTNTTANVRATSDSGGDLVTVGHARRRKGDPRKPEIGSALAVSRALQTLSDVFAEAADAS